MWTVIITLHALHFIHCGIVVRRMPPKKAYYTRSRTTTMLAWRLQSQEARPASALHPVKAPKPFHTRSRAFHFPLKHRLAAPPVHIVAEASALLRQWIDREHRRKPVVCCVLAGAPAAIMAAEAANMLVIGDTCLLRLQQHLSVVWLRPRRFVC